MQYALSAESKRIPASPGLHAFCPLCGRSVVAKCGTIKLWHWAHTFASNCDWHEPESLWHRSWKERFPEEFREVTMKPHRADVATRIMVVEFQKSHISMEDVVKRTLFYKNQRSAGLRWVVNTESFESRVSFSDTPTANSSSMSTFTLPKRRVEWEEARRLGATVVFDFSMGFFVGFDLWDGGLTWHGFWGDKEYFVNSALR